MFWDDDGVERFTSYLSAVQSVPADELTLLRTKVPDPREYLFSDIKAFHSPCSTPTRHGCKHSTKVQLPASDALVIGFVSLRELVTEMSEKRETGSDISQLGKFLLDSGVFGSVAVEDDIDWDASNTAVNVLESTLMSTMVDLFQADRSLPATYGFLYGAMCRVDPQNFGSPGKAIRRYNALFTKFTKEMGKLRRGSPQPWALAIEDLISQGLKRHWKSLSDEVLESVIKALLLPLRRVATVPRRKGAVCGGISTAVRGREYGLRHHLERIHASFFNLYGQEKMTTKDWMTWTEGSIFGEGQTYGFPKLWHVYSPKIKEAMPYTYSEAEDLWDQIREVVRPDYSVREAVPHLAQLGFPEPSFYSTKVKDAIARRPYRGLDIWPEHDDSFAPPSVNTCTWDTYWRDYAPSALARPLFGLVSEAWDVYNSLRLSSWLDKVRTVRFCASCQATEDALEARRVRLDARGMSGREEQSARRKSRKPKKPGNPGYSGYAKHRGSKPSAKFDVEHAMRPDRGNARTIGSASKDSERSGKSTASSPAVKKPKRRRRRS